MSVTDTVQRMLDQLPSYEANEPMIQRVYGALGNELDRMTATMDAIRDGLTPSIATDDYSGLSMLESQLGIPVKPDGRTDLQRRLTVLAWIQARRGGTGSAWVALMNLALGSTPWSYHEGPGEYEVTIILPLVEGSLTAGQLLAFARAITPAHIDIIPTYGTGFLIGISEIGVEPL